MSSRRRFYDIAATVCQLCKERQICIIHDHMVAFPQLCLICQVKRVDIMALTSGQFFSLMLEGFQELLLKDLERRAVISWILTA